MLIMKHSKILKYSITVIAIIGIYIGYRVFFNFNPELAYKWITGKEIPQGVTAVSYGSMINDNLFHSGHYWEFSHDESGLLKLLEQIGAGKEFENYENVTNYKEYDAIWTILNIETALGKNIDKNTIGKGYEIPGPNNRDGWLLVNKTGERSYYEYN